MRSLFALLVATFLAGAPPAFVKEGKGPGILLVHGFGGNRDVWKAVAAELAKDHTVVRVDLPGSGGTEGPPIVDGAADFETLAQDLVTLARKEGLVPCRIAGHSMGGPIAALAVLRDPAAFGGLVLVDSFLAAIPAAFLQPLAAALDQDPKAALEGFYGPMAAGTVQRDRLVAEALRIPVPVLKAYLKALAQDWLKGRQAELKLPVARFASGPKPSDVAKDEGKLAALGLAKVPGLNTAWFPGSHHWIMWDEPRAFLKEWRGMDARRVAR